MRKLILAILLMVIFVGQSHSTEPYEIKPIPPDSFRKVEVIYDPLPEKSELPRSVPSIRLPEPIIKEIKPKNTEPPKVAGTKLSGVASWYCKSGISRCTIGHSGGYYAAIRRDLLELRGSYVLVCSSEDCVRVKIIDCNCGPNANLIDLYWDAFAVLANPRLGIVKVTVSW